MKVPVGWTGKRVEIDPRWRVLDVGSGHAPNSRADVLLELLTDDDSERSGVAMNASDPRLVIGDACAMPFSDKEFDFIIASHLAEHVDDPGALCRELARVGRAGYIETPGWFGDMIMRESFHRWRVRRRGSTLEFSEVLDQRPFGVVGDWVYAVIYAGKRRPGHRTLFSTNPVGAGALTGLRYLIAALFRLPFVIDLMYTRYEWRGAIRFRVLRAGQAVPRPGPSGPGDSPS